DYSCLIWYNNDYWVF
nr:immunoglobulin light chain junction region [Macaca mulatta]MOY08637.1 immunoglobulin light chain junction region [Macaca mulatta]